MTLILRGIGTSNSRNTVQRTGFIAQHVAVANGSNLEISIRKMGRNTASVVVVTPKYAACVMVNGTEQKTAPKMKPLTVYLRLLSKQDGNGVIVVGRWWSSKKGAIT